MCSLSVSAYHSIVAGLVLLLEMGALGPSELEFVDIKSGSDTSVQVATVQIAQSREEWWRVYSIANGVTFPMPPQGIGIHGEAVGPKVDWEKQFVVALFGGQVMNVSSYEFVEVVQTPKEALVRIRARFPPATAQFITEPYAYLQLTRTKQTTVIQLADPTTAGGWRTIARVDPTWPLQRIAGRP